MDTLERNPLILQAIESVGSQASLADRMTAHGSRTSQSRVSRLLLGDVALTAEDAVALERATGIPRWRFRPDLWPQPVPEPANAPSPTTDEAA